MNLNYTLFGQLAAFLVFVLFCMRYVWPPILAAMEERQQKIADGLAAADRASHDLDLAQKEAVDRLSEAKKEQVLHLNQLLSYLKKGTEYKDLKIISITVGFLILSKKAQNYSQRPVQEKFTIEKIY